MSKPFELKVSDGYRNAHVGTCVHNDPDDRLYDFIHVQPLNRAFDYQLQYEVLTTRKIIESYDVVWVNTPVEILFSLKAMRMIEDLCPEQVQVFDAVIECKDGMVDTYKALNILNEVDVSDPEKSVMSKVIGYNKCVFKEDPMEPIHIARDAKFHPSIIISATLKEAFEKAKIKGCQYWPGDDA